LALHCKELADSRIAAGELEAAHRVAWKVALVCAVAQVAVDRR
jgi:hypothetical protein